MDQERLKKQQQELAAAALYQQLQHQQFLQLINRYLPTPHAGFAPSPQARPGQGGTLSWHGSDPHCFLEQCKAMGSFPIVFTAWEIQCREFVLIIFCFWVVGSLVLLSFLGNSPDPHCLLAWGLEGSGSSPYGNGSVFCCL